jgi:hypothetical protein
MTSPEAAALAALEAGQIPAQDLYRAMLDDRDRLLEENAALRRQVTDLRRAIDLGKTLVGVMEGQA